MNTLGNTTFLYGKNVVHKGISSKTDCGYMIEAGSFGVDGWDDIESYGRKTLKPSILFLP